LFFKEFRFEIAELSLAQSMSRDWQQKQMIPRPCNVPGQHLTILSSDWLTFTRSIYAAKCQFWWNI